MTFWKVLHQIRPASTRNVSAKVDQLSSNIKHLWIYFNIILQTNRYAMIGPWYTNRPTNGPQGSSCRIHPWMLREVHVSTAGSLWGMLPFKPMKYEWVSKLLEPYKTSGFLLEIDQFGLVGGVGGHPFRDTLISSWWFQPIWKILVKMGIFPK